ncbi:MAG: ABC transporter permease [Acutalibacteraceae bacterium]|nr:ABC transporter permease [Acutalibacteraceae bacterium]
MKRESLGQKILRAPYILWSALFIIIPLVIMGYYALTDANGVFSLANFSDLGRYKKAFLLSLLYAAISTVITLLISYPLSYFMTKCSPSAQRMLMILTMLPMWTNFLIRTYSWITILSNTGIINTFLSKFGIGPLHLINRPGTVILGMVYDFLPYMILPIYNVMSKIDVSLTEAAEDLGANKLRTIGKVIFPLSMPGVISGITMVFVPSVSTFYISQKLGGNKTMLIGDMIEYLFNLGPDYYNVASAISMVLMAIILVSLFIMNRFSDDSDGGVVI